MKTNLSFRPVLKVISACMLAIGLSTAAYAAAPVAGTIITNQASATYSLSGSPLSVLSNSVTTRVSEVYAVDIVNDQTLPGTAGQTIYFPHTIINNGNASDTFNLSAAFAGAAVDGVVIYADFDGDGVADSFVPITTTPALAIGATYSVVLAVHIPATALITDAGTATITATSVNDGAQSDSNTDTIDVTNNAIVNIAKTMSAGSGIPGSTQTVTISYANNGLKTASTVTLADVLPAGMTYVAGTGRWSVSGVTPMDDTSGANDPAGINYVYTLATDRVDAVISSIPAGAVGTLTFDVTIDAAQPAGLLNNTATVQYDVDPADGTGTLVSGVDTTWPFNVLQSYAVNLTDAGSTTDTPATTDDNVIVPSANQGATVVFDNVLINTGNGIDTFNITTNTSTYPVGTTFIMYQGDGVTALVDSNGDSIVDTGPVAAGATFHVIMKAILPPSATGGPFTVNKTATSVGSPATSNSVIDTLTTIVTSTVDLTNDALNTLGAGSGVGAATPAVTTLSTNPNVGVNFDLYVNNTSAVADSYNLSFGSTSSLPLSAAALSTAGWTVVFHLGSAAGPVISNTGSIPAGGQAHIVAVVTPPANAAGNVTTDVFFAAVSASTLSGDVKRDAVTVNPLHDLSIIASSSASTPANTGYIFTHTLTNLGNVTETSDVISASSAYAAVVYLDANNNGVLDGADPIFNNISQVTTGAGVATNGQLAAGESVRVFVRVSVPLNAVSGDVNVVTLSLAGASGETVTSNDTLLDTLTVNTGPLALSKTQALDANCDNTPEGSFVTTQFDVKPAGCVIYKVDAINLGLVQLDNVIVTDATPANTTYNGGLTAVSSASSSAPAAATTGNVTATWTTLAPSATVTMQFRVQVDN